MKEEKESHEFAILKVYHEPIIIINPVLCAWAPTRENSDQSLCCLPTSRAPHHKYKIQPNVFGIVKVFPHPDFATSSVVIAHVLYKLLLQKSLCSSFLLMAHTFKPLSFCSCYFLCPCSPPLLRLTKSYTSNYGGILCLK